MGDHGLFIGDVCGFASVVSAKSCVIYESFPHELDGWRGVDRLYDYLRGGRC